MLFYQEVSSHPNASQVMILKNPAGSVAQSDGFSTLQSKISLRLVHVAFLTLSTKSGLSVSYTYICLYIYIYLYIYMSYVYVIVCVYIQICVCGSYKCPEKSRQSALGTPSGSPVAICKNHSCASPRKNKKIL